MFGLGVERSGAALSAFLDVWLERLRSGAAPVKVLSVNICLICGIVRLLEIDRTCPLALVPSPLHLSLSIGRPLQALGMDAELSCARAQHTKVLKASATATDGICWSPPPPTGSAGHHRPRRPRCEPSAPQPSLSGAPFATSLLRPTAVLIRFGHRCPPPRRFSSPSRPWMGARWSSGHGAGRGWGRGGAPAMVVARRIGCHGPGAVEFFFL
jgi:hypothetical protein